LTNENKPSPCPVRSVLMLLHLMGRQNLIDPTTQPRIKRYRQTAV